MQRLRAGGPWISLVDLCGVSSEAFKLLEITTTGWHGWGIDAEMHVFFSSPWSSSPIKLFPLGSLPPLLFLQICLLFLDDFIMR